MLRRYFVRVHRRDGSIQCSPFFESLDEAVLWKLAIPSESLVLAAVIVEILVEPHNLS